MLKKFVIVMYIHTPTTALQAEVCQTSSSEEGQEEASVHVFRHAAAAAGGEGQPSSGQTKPLHIPTLWLLC